MKKAAYQIGLKQVFLIAKIKYTILRTYVISDLKMKNLLQFFMKENCKKQIKKSLELKKLIKRKGDRLYVRWKGNDNSFNSWINKKEIVI